MNWQSRLWLMASISTCFMFCATGSGCFQEDSEEHGHMHHEIPAHKPSHFPAAVKELQQRWPGIGKAKPREKQEFIDILNWIPELAAQTDLEQHDWDEAVEQATMISAGMNQKGQSDSAAIQQALARLQALARKAIEIDTFNSLK